MAGEIGSAYLSMLPSFRGFGSKLDQGVSPEINRSGKRQGSRFGTVFASASLSPLRAIGAAAVGLFAIDKTVGFFKDSIAEARESQKVNALTTSTIKATGGAANITAKQVGNLAGALSLKTGIDDETIQSGANMLLTFKNIRNEAGKGNDIFNQSTKTLVDLAAAMGTEPKQAAIQLGKALNDPIKGVSALSRVGVTFDDQQKNQIKTLVTSGKTAQAQKIILKELSSEFGGAAAAQATAGDKFKTAFGNLKESIGTALLPVVDAVLNKLSSLAINLSGKIGPAFSAIGKFVAPVAAQIGKFFSSLGGSGEANKAGSSLISFAKSIASTVLPVLVAVGRVIVTQVIPFVVALARGFITNVLPVIIKVASSVASSLLPVFKALANTFVTQVLPALQNAFTVIKPYIPTFLRVAGVVLSVLGFFVRLGAAVLGFLLPPLIKLVGFLLGGVIRAIAATIAGIGGFLRALGAIGSAVGRVIGFMARFAALVVAAVVIGFSKLSSIVRSAFAAVARFVASGVTKAVGVVRQVSAISKIFSAAFGAARSAVAGGIGKVVGLMRSLPGKIKGALGNVRTLLSGVGGQIIAGLKSGIENAAHLVGEAVHAIVSRIPAAVRKIMGIASPSRVMHQLGVYTGQGYAIGLTSSLGQASNALNQLQVPDVNTRSLALSSIGSAPSGSAPAVFNIYDSDDMLMGTLYGVADDAYHSNVALAGG